MTTPDVDTDLPFGVEQGIGLGPLTTLELGGPARSLFEARHDKTRAMLQWNQLLASVGSSAAH